MKGKGRSSITLSMLLRGGSGRHSDKRLKRLKTRSAQKRAALREGD